MNIQNQRLPPLRGVIFQHRRALDNQNVQNPHRVVFQWPIGYGNHMARKLNEQNKQKMWQIISQQDKELFDDFHPYGLVFFNNQITNKQSFQLFPYIVIQMLRWHSWTISINNEDDLTQWPKRLAMMKECHIDYLQFRISNQVSDSQLWKSIEPISFPDLINLELYKCAVINIQPLAYLNAPKLQKINLIYNQVSQFKVLNKLDSQQLKQLYLTNRSEIEAFSSLLETTCLSFENSSRWNFELKDLRLEKHYYNSVITDDLSFLAKSKSIKSMKGIKISVCRQSRILQKKLIERYNKETQLVFQIFKNFPDDLLPQNLELYQIRE